MAGELVDSTVGPRHGQLTLPGPRVGCRIVDLELVEQRVRLEQTEALSEAQVAIPREVAAGIAVVAVAVGKVRGLDHERVAFPAADRIAQPLPDRGWEVRPTVEVDDARVVDHLGVDDEGVRRLNELIVAVVRIRQHRRARSRERQTPILQAEVFRMLEALQSLQALASDLSGGWRQRRDAAIRWIGHDGRPARLDGARAELAIERVVGAGAAPLRRLVRRRLFVAPSRLPFPLRGFGRREDRLVP